MNWINNKVLINCLANSFENAIDIKNASEGRAIIGLLSQKYNSTEEAIEIIRKYKTKIGDCISVGLGSGNPKMWKRVATIASAIKPIHINQVFTATGFTKAIVQRKDTIINSLMSPTGKVGFVKISTGEFSQNYEPVIAPIETAIIMAKEQGANSIKFFNMRGLKHLKEFSEIAKFCAKHDMILEPTGGINADNISLIMEVALKMGVKKVIPHVYSSIIDQETGNTKINDLKKIISMVSEIANKY